MPDYSPATTSAAQVTNEWIESPNASRDKSIFWQKGLHYTRADAQSFQASLNSPSLSNQYRVSLNFGNTGTGAAKNDVNTWIAKAGVWGDKYSGGTARFDFLCSEASLPGSNFMSFEETGSRQGITETFPQMRSFTDLQLKFYVSSDYKAIRLFQEWINFINPTYTDKRNIDSSPRGQVSQNARSGFTRMRYPDSYKREITVTKFERSYGYSDFHMDEGKNVADVDAIEYNMVNAFPESMEAIPLSYEDAQLVQCTVNLKYDRFYVTQLNKSGPKDSGANSNNVSDPTDILTQQGQTLRNNITSGEDVTDRTIVRETQ